MRLTIWQFLALIAALVGGYLVYTMFIAKQDQNAVVRNFNNSIKGDTERVETTRGANGQPVAASEGDSGEPAKNIW